MSIKFKQTSFGEKMFLISNNLFMIFLVIAMIYPFFIVLMLSVSTRIDIYSTEFRLIPRVITFESYEKLLEGNIVFISYGNTIFRTVIGTSISVILCFSVAYALSKKALPFRKMFTLFLIFTMFFSGGLIPTYMLIKNLGLINNRLVYIIPGLYNVWYILLMRNYIMAIPDSLEEAAVIDGATPIQIMWTIMFPVSSPIIATVALWIGVAHWNAWFDALIYITENNKQVLQMIVRKIVIMEKLRDLVEGMDQALENSGVKFTEEGVKAAAIIVTIGPIIFAYPFAQKYFIKGIMVGSLKG